MHVSSNKAFISTNNDPIQYGFTVLNIFTPAKLFLKVHTRASELFDILGTKTQPHNAKLRNSELFLETHQANSSASLPTLPCNASSFRLHWDRARLAEKRSSCNFNQISHTCRKKFTHVHKTVCISFSQANIPCCITYISNRIRFAHQRRQRNWEPLDALLDFVPKNVCVQFVQCAKAAAASAPAYPVKLCALSRFKWGKTPARCFTLSAHLRAVATFPVHICSALLMHKHSYLLLSKSHQPFTFKAE